jgi:hypothetical protein
MRGRWIILLILIAFISIGAIYGWNEYHRTNKSLSKVEASYKLSSQQLIQEFETSDTVAGNKYLGKIVSINGKIKQVDKDPEGNYTLVLGTAESSTSVRCAMDTTYRSQVSNLKEADVVTVKGTVTGFQKDETGLLGSDVKLNRCVLEDDIKH